jgi:hypothetical protein
MVTKEISGLLIFNGYAISAIVWFYNATASLRKPGIFAAKPGLKGKSSNCRTTVKTLTV